jgi:hypothetical protein
MSAIQARVHFAMKQEFRLLAAIIRDNTPTEYDYDPEIGDRSAKQGDYDMVEVIPVSDPNASTMSQRIVQYQAVLELSKTNPQIYDQQYLHRQMIETLGIKNASKLVPIEDDMKSLDPVSENMNIIMGKPVKAFITQDHDAHMAVHTMFLQDPKLAAQMGQNPQAQALLGALHAHIMEHVAYQYRSNIEKLLGAPLTPFPTHQDENKLTPEIESEVSRLSALAAAKLLQKDIAEQQMQQAQEQMQDPLLQLQQAEVQNDTKEVERKIQKDKIDAQLKKEKQDADMMIKAAQLKAKAAESNTKSQNELKRMKLDGVRLASDIHGKNQGREDELHKHNVGMQADMHKHNSSMENKNQQNAMSFATKNQSKPNVPKDKKGE